MSHVTINCHYLRRIKMQHQRLAQEMQDAAVAGLIQRRPRIKASRSLPAIVMKPAPKPRVSLGEAYLLT